MRISILDERRSLLFAVMSTNIEQYAQYMYRMIVYVSVVYIKVPVEILLCSVFFCYIYLNVYLVL